MPIRALNMCLVPEAARRGHQIPCNWSYSYLWTTTWVLGLRSNAGAASVLICWATTSTLSLFFRDRISLCRLGWPWTQSNPPASVSWVLGLQVWSQHIWLPFLSFMYNNVSWYFIRVYIFITPWLSPVHLHLTDSLPLSKWSLFFLFFSFFKYIKAGRYVACRRAPYQWLYFWRKCLFLSNFLLP